LKGAQKLKEVTNMDQTERKALGDVFDRTIRSLSGLATNDLAADETDPCAIFLAPYNR
jgi:hypothetical protein